MSEAASAKRRIVIAGGGLAGWMSALVLARVLPPAQRELLLIDLPARSPDPLLLGGVAAALPALMDFLPVLGMAPPPLVARAAGGFRLATQFRDWGRPGEAYLHSFGDNGAPLDALPFHQHWLRMRAFGETAPLEEYALASAAARLGRFQPPSEDPASVLSTYTFGLQLDGPAFVAELRRGAEANGVRAIAADIAGTELDGETGFIRALRLDSGERVEADFFVDCSGARALLISEALKVGYEDWSHWLPCDRAVWTSAPASNPSPLAQIDAADAGWRWRMDTQRGASLGAAFSSAHESEAKAAQALGDGEVVTAPLRSGRRIKAWSRNCVAVGEAAGFIEPIEPVNLHLAQQSLTRLLRLFPQASWPESDEAEYNRIIASEYERARDFVLLHYAVSERADTPFWRERRAAILPDSLDYRIKLFGARGRVLLLDEETFQFHSWVAVMLGQGLIPRRHDPLVDASGIDSTRLAFKRMREIVRKAAESMPPHGEFLRRFCRAEPVANAS